MEFHKCSLRENGSRTGQYRLFSDYSKETIAFEGELIAEVESPIYMFPETRNWNKRIIRLYKAGNSSYIYQSVDHWARCPSPDSPHQNVMRFDDAHKMLCVLLQDLGDRAVLDTDVRLILAAMKRDEAVMDAVEALRRRPSGRRRG